MVDVSVASIELPIIWGRRGSRREDIVYRPSRKTWLPGKRAAGAAGTAEPCADSMELSSPPRMPRDLARRRPRRARMRAPRRREEPEHRPPPRGGGVGWVTAASRVYRRGDARRALLFGHGGPGRERKEARRIMREIALAAGVQETAI